MHGANTRRKRSRTRHAIAALGATCVLVAGQAFAVEAPNHVRDVSMHAAAGLAEGVEIEIVGTGTPVYTVRLDEAGKRLLVELTNADVTLTKPAVTNGIGVVGGILTQAFRTDTGSVARLSINLAKAATYRVRVEGNVLRITLAPAGTTLPGGTNPAASPVAAGTKMAADAKATHVTTDKPQVAEVRFERAKAGDPSCGRDGCDRVLVRLSKIPAYRILPSASNRLRLELKDTKVSEELCRTLDVTAFHGSLSAVNTFFDAKTGNTIIELERTDEADGTLVEQGSALVWMFSVPKNPKAAAAKDAATPNPAPKDVTSKDGGPSRKIVTVARESEPANVPQILTSFNGTETKIESVDGSEAAFHSNVQGQAVRQGRYNGRRIDLDLKDADIHNILRLLADVGKVNIITADDVQGTVTIRLRNVPWDQALDVVLQAKGLGMLRQGNLIRVAPMAQLQKERELRLAQAKAEYELTPLETRLIPVSYAQADELQARAKDLLSPRGSIAVDERTNVLIARDIAANLNHIEELVRSLDTQTPQVLVEARIVEATSKYLRDVGIQWGGDMTFSEATGNPTGVAFPSKVTAAGGNYDTQTPTAGLSPFTRNVTNPNFAVNLPAAVGTGSGGALGLSFGSIDNNFNLGVRLSAAESSGLLRVVSSPRILTLDNREARINQGTLIPFAQVSALGVQTTFQEAKLQLLVRPHVTADGSIAMHVKISRDEPDFNQTSARGDPTILKREAETDLLVMDGRTAVIGGIYTRNTGRNLDQVPFFGDIPILGVLFQRRRASDSRNELVIFLTPRIVNRAEALGR